MNRFRYQRITALALGGKPEGLDGVSFGGWNLLKSQSIQRQYSHIREKGQATRARGMEEYAKEMGIEVKIIRQLLGGYQVIKKWLSYRKRSLLGRSLRLEETTEVGTMARRLAA